MEAYVGGKEGARDLNVKYVGRFVGGSKPGMAEHCTEVSVESRVRVMEVATGKGAVCNTVTILVDLDVMSMSTDIVWRVHERPHRRTWKAYVVV